MFYRDARAGVSAAHQEGITVALCRVGELARAMVATEGARVFSLSRGAGEPGCVRDRALKSIGCGYVHYAAAVSAMPCHGLDSQAGYAGGSRRHASSIPTRTSALRFDSTQEPDALVAQVQICAGGGEQSPALVTRNRRRINDSDPAILYSTTTRHVGSHTQKILQSCPPDTRFPRTYRRWRGTRRLCTSVLIFAAIIFS